MNDYLKMPTQNKVEECRVLGGIDTLYFFVDTVRSELYHKIWSLVLLEQFQREGYSFLGFSGKSRGFVGAWFNYRRDSVLLFRVGFKDPSKQKNVNNIQVQLYASGIYYLGFFDLLHLVRAELSSLLEIDLDYSHFITSRVDLNAFVDGFDFSQISSEMFRSRFACSEPHSSSQYAFDLDDTYNYSKHHRLQSLYLGSRQNSLYFKIYDKKLEMISRFESGGEEAFQSTIKLAYLQEHGFWSDHIWNIEFTLKREVLKQFSIFTVSDLFDLGNSVFKQLCSSCAFLGFDLDLITDSKNNNHISRLPMHPIWQKIVDSYDFFVGGVDSQRIYARYKNITKEKSTYILAKQLEKQIGLDQAYSQREWNDIFYNYERILSTS